MKKILVIEDDPAIADFAVAALRRAEFEVRHAPDGTEGLEAARGFRPDLVVLDLMMPGIHGIQVLERLRADEAFAKVPVLVTSAKSYASDIECARESGASDYLTKPYKAQDLMKKVERLIGGGNGGSPAPPADEPSDRFTRTARRAAEPEQAVADPAKQSVLVRFWGTRGSCPAPGPDTVRYGGNTSCTEIRFGDHILVVDCGSGLRELGDHLINEFGDKSVEGHLFVGHTHWDHIQGFPFFRPFYVKKNKFNIYSVRGAGKSLERVFRGQMASDYFPIPLKSLACQLEFVEMEAPISIGPVRVRYHFLNHPGIAIGFRFEAFGKSVTYISDHETFTRLNGPSDATRKQDQDIVEFARGTDLLISEAQYDEEEYKVKKGWGHSTFDDVIERGLASECKHLVLFHHDPTHTDEMMDRYLDECREKIRKAGGALYCSAARERHTIKL